MFIKKPSTQFTSVSNPELKRPEKSLLKSKNTKRRIVSKEDEMKTSKEEQKKAEEAAAEIIKKGLSMRHKG